MANDLAVREQRAAQSYAVSERVRQSVPAPRRGAPMLQAMLGGSAMVIAISLALIAYATLDNGGGKVDGQTAATVDRLVEAVGELTEAQAKQLEADERVREQEQKAKIKLSPKEQKALVFGVAAVIAIGIGFGAGGPVGGLIATAFVIVSVAYATGAVSI